MKYFTVTYVSQKTLHPDGYKTFTAFVSADTKHAAKLKALEVLSEKDPVCCMMCKVPRLEEISEEDYLRNTEHQIDIVDVQAINQYCALLAIFGEQEDFDDDERRDAVELLACPEDEPEVYAEYLSLRRRVAETLADMPVSISQPEIQALAVQLYNGESVGEYEIPNSLNIDSVVSTEIVDNPAHIPVEVAESEQVQAVNTAVNISSINDARSPELTTTERREYPHNHYSLKLEVACALCPESVSCAEVSVEALWLAKEKIRRCEEDVVS